jgi:hypothetical protein
VQAANAVNVRALIDSRGNVFSASSTSLTGAMRHLSRRERGRGLTFPRFFSAPAPLVERGREIRGEEQNKQRVRTLKRIV